jgi:DNA-binding NarL/FixJ family response regulator
VLLFDLKLAEGNGVLPLLIIRARSPQTKVILLVGRTTDAQILGAISHGARGYLAPKLLRRFLVKAIRAVHAGETWVSRAMVGKIIDQLASLTAQQAYQRKA